MTYLELVNQIQTRHVPDYYELLLVHSNEILMAYRTRTQTQLATDLGLTQTQVSLLLKILNAYVSLHNGE